MIVTLDPTWVPLQSRPAAVVAGMYSTATVPVSYLDEALAGFADVVPAALRPVDLAGFIVCSSDECARLLRISIDTVFVDAAAITFADDPSQSLVKRIYTGSVNVIAVDSVLNARWFDATVLIHEWGHAIDFRWAQALGTTRHAAPDFAGLWATVQAVATAHPEAGAVYGWTSAVECFAEVFRSVLMEAAGSTEAHFGRTAAQELRLITTGSTETETAATELARSIMLGLSVPPLVDLARATVSAYRPSLSATVTV